MESNSIADSNRSQSSKVKSERERHKHKSSGNADHGVTPEQTILESDNGQHKQGGRNQQERRNQEKKRERDRSQGRNQGGPNQETKSTSTESRQRRSRRGGVRNGKRRANREAREREEARRRSEALLYVIPEQRGSIQGQRAVDRRSMIDQPWRQQGGTRVENGVVAGGAAHMSDSNRGQWDMPRKPVGGDASGAESSKKIPTEPKSDLLARQRRKAGKTSPSRTEGLQTRFNGYEETPLRERLRLPDYKFGDDEWSLDELKSGEASNHKDTVTEKRQTEDSLQKNEDATDRPVSTASSTIDWESIRQRMESKMGKHTSVVKTGEPLVEEEAKETDKDVEGTDAKGASTSPPKATGNPQTVSSDKSKQPQKLPAAAKNDSPGWSFDNIV